MRLWPAPRRAARSRFHVHPLTASAQRPSSDTASVYRRLAQEWQADALYLYDRVGELAYPANSFANVFGKIRFFPAVLNDRGEPEEVESGPLVDLWQRVKDQSGGTVELQESYGRLQFVVGDGYLTVTEQDGTEIWEYLSPLEIRLKPEETSSRQGYTRIRAPGIAPQDLVQAPDEDFELLGDQAQVWRLYRRHPAYSQWADSSVRSVIDLYKFLLRLTQAADAEALSRVARKGIFYMPLELDFGTSDPEDSSVDEDPDADGFFQEWEEMVMKPIREPGTAAAAASAVIRGPALMATPTGAIPMKDCLGHVPVGPSDGYIEAEMWEKTIRRISLGTLLPPEFITGSGDLNHWSGWLVDEQFFRMHFTPAAQRYASDLNSAYLRPAAENAGLPEADRVIIGFDPEDAISHPDEFKTALEMHKALVVSDEYLRAKGGAQETDKPNEEELDRRISITLKDIAGALGEDPEGETPPEEGGRGGDTDETAPEQPGQQRRNGTEPPVQAAAMMRILGAAELAIERSRELAGNRIRTKAKQCEECRRMIDGLHGSLVAPALGPEVVADVLKGSYRESSLVAGGGGPFKEAIIKWGVVDEWADELSKRIEDHALRTLYEETPPPIPIGFTRLVKKALA